MYIYIYIYIYTVLGPWIQNLDFLTLTHPREPGGPALKNAAFVLQYPIAATKEDEHVYIRTNMHTYVHMCMIPNRKRWASWLTFMQTLTRWRSTVRVWSARRLLLPCAIPFFYFIDRHFVCCLFHAQLISDTASTLFWFRSGSMCPLYSMLTTVPSAAQ